MKQCNHCGIKKDLSEFQVDWRRRDGHTNFCKLCAAKKANNWHHRNRDAHNAKMKAWWQKNKRRRPDRHLWALAKRRAKKDRIPFTLVPYDIEVPKVCPVLGVPLVFERVYSPNAPSLDRIVPELGYVPGNVQVISHKANTMKSNASLSELKSLVAWLETQGASHQPTRL